MVTVTEYSFSRIALSPYPEEICDQQALKKIKVVGESEKCPEVVSKFYSCLVAFYISLAARCNQVLSMLTKGASREPLRTLDLLTFIGNVNKRQYFKVYSLKFDEIWQKTRSSVNENLKN